MELDVPNDWHGPGAAAAAAAAMAGVPAPAQQQAAPIQAPGAGGLVPLAIEGIGNAAGGAGPLFAAVAEGPAGIQQLIGLVQQAGEVEEMANIGRLVVAAEVERMQREAEETSDASSDEGMESE